MKKKPIILLVLILIICSLFMPLSINYTGQSKILSYNKLNRYISLSRLDGISTENFIYYNKSKVGFSLKNELNSYDGIKNGIVVIGNYFRNIVVGSTLDYLNGFDVISSNAKMIWLFFGIFLELAKNIIFSSIEFIVMIIILLLQATVSYTYILFYLLTILFISGILYVYKKQTNCTIIQLVLSIYYLYISIL